jgi:hypothetical protein
MAKKQIRKWKFTPGGANLGTITVPGSWAAEKILLITNVTQGVILYNFADTQNAGAVSVNFRPGALPNLDSSGKPVAVYTAQATNYSPSGERTAKIQNVEWGTGETTITLKLDTSTHSANDRLSILVEENFQYTRPWSDFGTDAIERARIAAPQTMIDADFEYGLQPTKWQGYQLINYYPSIYEAVTPDLTVNSVFSSSNTSIESTLITVGVTNHGLVTGDPITVSQLRSSINGFDKAEGASVVFSANTNFFQYFAKGQVGTTSNADIRTNRTQIRKGGFYSGADLPLAFVKTDGAATSTITMDFATPHGFIPGMPVIITSSVSSPDAAMLYLPGPYYVTTVANSTRVSFAVRGTVSAGGSGYNSGTDSRPDAYGNLMLNNPYSIKIYARPDGFITHRPGDGGVILGTGSPIHGASVTRQSKKYFRYQSGKGFLYTTGVLFAPNYDIVSITADTTSVGGTITCTVSIPHGLQVGAIIRISEVATAGYDGTFTVDEVVDVYTVRFENTGFALGSTTGVVGNVPKLFMYQWHGACMRTGPHDDANGMYFEYDGSNFNVIKRTSTLQLAGTVTLVPNSNQIIGDLDRSGNTSTLFTSQLKIGDNVVIKGMVHKVGAVINNGTISVNPDFRGVTGSSNNYIWKVEEVRIKQSDFNRDTADGTGGSNNPSGFWMDPNKMQMVGIQFSWYGAGFMDYMVRGYDANFIILHRIKQNNINNTASMRSANLPVRYQVVNEGASGVTSISTLFGGLSATEGSTGQGAGQIAVYDATFFPTKGNILIENEVIQYDGKVMSAGLGQHVLQIPEGSRGQTYQTFIGGSYKTFKGVNGGTVGTGVAHDPGVGVELISQTATPTMSHWGSSYIIDGGFDLDRGYQFSYTVTDANVYTTGNTVLGLRLSPSAANSITGDLGERDLLNRAQILLRSINVACGDQRTGGNVQILVTGMLNPSNYSEASQTWNSLNTVAFGNEPSFSQVTNAPVFTGTNKAAQPGEKLFEYIYDPRTQQAFDLSQVKELSQSSVGGRGTFPNGSDSLYITLTALPGAVTLDSANSATSLGGTVTNIRFVSNVHVTMQWGEAQA